MTTPIELALPFAGRWQVRNSPARRVPSHGTDLLGTRYAIDFVGVDEQHRFTEVRDWRTLLATEPAERFVSFGRPILAPVDGVVVEVGDGEVDHAGRRSQLALVPYMLGQAGRFRRGVRAIAGNYVTIAVQDNVFVSLVHLRRGSLAVGVGDAVSRGQRLGDCGNSGNSTQPHVHVQATDSRDLTTASGLPIAFAQFREWDARGRASHDIKLGMPGEGSVVEPLSEAGRTGV